jgi:hypothetical protein
VPSGSLVVCDRKQGPDPDQLLQQRIDDKNLPFQPIDEEPF